MQTRNKNSISVFRRGDDIELLISAILKNTVLVRDPQSVAPPSQVVGQSDGASEWTNQRETK
jgi:hypothetical protein